MLRSRQVVRLSACLGLVLVSASACLNVNEPPALPVYSLGAVELRAKIGPGGTGKTTPTAVFFEAYSAAIPDSRNRPNTCAFGSVDTSFKYVVGVMRAGNTVDLKIGANANSTTTALAFDAVNKRYDSGTASLLYNPGDTVRATITGEAGGFPASAISVRLAEPLATQQVNVPVSGQPMQFRWTSTNDPTAAIIISLKYANPSNASYANEQILCDLKDTGSYDILAANLTGFLASPAAKRSLLMTRWRTDTVRVNDKALLHIVSAFDTLVVLH